MVFPKNIATFARFRFLRSRSRHQNKPTKQTKTHNVMIKKTSFKGAYATPDCEVLNIELNRVICQSDEFNTNNHTEYLGEEEDGGNL